MKSFKDYIVESSYTILNEKKKEYTSTDVINISNFFKSVSSLTDKEFSKIVKDFFGVEHKVQLKDKYKVYSEHEIGRMVETFDTNEGKYITGEAMFVLKNGKMTFSDFSGGGW